MSFEAGTVICANCGAAEDEHCVTCWSCPRDPIKECCMAGWPEHLKAHERQRARELAAGKAPG